MARQASGAACKGMLAGVMVSLLAMCGGDSQRPIDPPRAAAQEPERRFDPAVAAAPGPILEGRRANRVTPLLARTTDRGTLGSLLWLAAERGEDAEGALARLAGLEHPLSRWAGVLLAERLEETDPARASTLAEPLTDDWTGQSRAQRVRARALLRAGETDAAKELLRALVAGTPAHIGGASVAMPLADHLAQLDDEAARLEALGLYRRVATRAPKADVGREAATKAEALLAALPRALRDAHQHVPVSDRIVEAEALYNSMHHQDAERAYAAILESLEEEDPRRCGVMLERGNAMLRRRAREEGAPWMRQVAQTCDGDVRAWARYKGGRAFGQLGRKDEALTEYAALLEEAPTHRLADDALYWSAQLQEEDETAYVAGLTRMVDTLPEGDMAGDAFFLLAMRARAAGELEAALSWLDRAIAAGPGEEAEDIRGRAAYWRARVLAQLGRETSAEAYESLARQWPLSYYGQQAMARLRDADAGRAAEVARAMSVAGEELDFPWRDELEDPRFQRAVALLQVGAVDLAREELEDLGFMGPGADADAVWLSAALLQAAGALPECTRLVRARLESFRGTMPAGAARPLWRLAYPRAFAPLIEDTAGPLSVPPSLVRAIAREESSFDPSAVSWAHAYGLTQLILPTARRFGRDLDTRIDARSLKRPEVNVAVGARYLAYLRERFDANPALVPAAYNAGHGALSRWLRERGEMDMDEFVEAIPYEETRRYTRRVIQSYGIYSWLDEQALPELPRRVR